GNRAASPSLDGRWVGRFNDVELKGGMRLGDATLQVWGLADDSLVTVKLPPLPEPVRKPGPNDLVPGVLGYRGGVCSRAGRRVTMGFRTSYELGKHDVEGAWESSLRLWDLDAGRQLMVVRRLGAVTERTFSPDGRLLAALFDPPGEVMVWDALTGQYRYTLKLPRGKNFMVAFSTDGSRMVAVGG